MNQHTSNEVGQGMDIESLRVVSKGLTGSTHRLEICAELGRRELPLTYAREVARALELPENVVGNEMRRLHEAGLLRKVGRVSGPQVYYERQDSRCWQLFEALAEEATHLVTSP